MAKAKKFTIVLQLLQAAAMPQQHFHKKRRKGGCGLEELWSTWLINLPKARIAVYQKLEIKCFCLADIAHFSCCIFMLSTTQH
jgi:hypothetical protein